MFFLKYTSLLFILLFITGCVQPNTSVRQNFSNSNNGLYTGFKDSKTPDTSYKIISETECANRSGKVRKSEILDNTYICELPNGNTWYLQKTNSQNTNSDFSQRNNINLDISSSKKAYDLGNFTKAYEEFLTLAKENNSEAQYYLALMYANAQYVEKDMISAYAWSKLSAKNGFEKAKEFNAVVKNKVLSDNDLKNGDLKFDEIVNIIKNSKPDTKTENKVTSNSSSKKGASDSEKQLCIQKGGENWWDFTRDVPACKIRGNLIPYSNLYSYSDQSQSISKKGASDSEKQLCIQKGGENWWDFTRDVPACKIRGSLVPYDRLR